MKRNGKCGFRVWTIAVIYVTLFWSNVISQTAVQPAGSGTQVDPYQIANLDNLYWLSQNSSAWNKYYIQTADINAAATSGWNSGAGFSPIGSNDVYFQGTYNGQNHTISGLFIDRGSSGFVGLFGNAIYGTIQNLGLVNCSIRGGLYAGGLVGYGGQVIKNCYTTGTVTGTDNYTGGLIGRSYYSYISQCYSTANVSGIGDVGGLIGRTAYTYLLNNCYATGDVSGTNKIGGLVGNHSYGTIDSCYSIGKVTGDSLVGGLVGINNATVAHSYYDSACAKQSDTGKGTPLSTAEMKTQATFGWDFNNIWALESSFNNGYPYLRWQSTEPPAPIATAPTLGDGSSGDPYQISSLEHLRWLAEQVNSTTSPNTFSGMNFVQTADINASETYSWDDGNGGTKEGWLPIGTSGYPFSGNYNGNGHRISELYINRSESAYVGLFGWISGCTIENLTIENCVISGSLYVGGLTGLNENLSTIRNCTVEGTIIGSSDYVGGLTGTNSGSTISNCQTNCTVTGLKNIGGLAGVNSTYNYNYGRIIQCVARGKVSGYFYVGGLVGQNYYCAYLNECCALDSVIGTKPGEGYYVRYIGGLAGMNIGSSYISDCYARGAVIGEDYIGGLVGYNDGSSIGNSYATGVVSGASNTGGLAGGNSLSVGNSFYDSTTARQNDTGKGTPKSTANMKKLATFTAAGWDFEIEDANGTNDYWDIDFTGSNNNGYPFLAWQNGSAISLSLPVGTIPSVGNGTKTSPFEIATFENLTWVAVDTNNWDKHYIQTADINAAETYEATKWLFGGWMPIGKESKAFTGSYDGNGHLIDSLYISRTAGSYQGFFGHTLNDTIRNLGLTNATITGDDRVGALIGFADGTTVQECFSAGSVSGSEYIGGLIGLNYQNVVNNCYSNAVISGASKVGGLIGRHENATLNNCYSTGSVSGSEYAGGLVGRNYSSTDNNCFWDTETSGKTSSQGGTGKTTTEMKTLATFTSAGWDFTDTWAMSTTFNAGYPYLQWQYAAPQTVTLTLNAAELDFGPVTVGQSYDTTFTITNTGNDTLFITQIQSSNPKFSVKSAQFMVLPGANFADTLWFAPEAAGADSGYIIITSNAVSSPDTVFVKGAGVPVVGITAGAVPREFALNQNYPNPFNPTTNIMFSLAKDAQVTLNIYDLTGREVAVLVNSELLNAGNYTRVWNAAEMPTGLYLCRIQAGDFSAVRKLVLVK